jgi:hypothetical protein
MSPKEISGFVDNALLWSSTGLYAPQAPVTDLSGYYTKSEADARYPQKTDVDPYPNYLTSTEADALFLTPAEGNAAYATAAHNHDAAYVQLTGGSVMTGLLGPTTNNTRDLGTTALRWRALYGMTGDFTTSLTVASKAVGVSLTGGNTLAWNSDGFYVAAGAVTDIWVDVLGDTMTGVLNMAANVLPTTNNTRDLGSTSLRWRKLWAVDTDLSGVLGVTGAVTLTAGLTVGTTLSVNSRPVIMAGCRVVRTAVQTFTTGAAAVIAFTAERFDTDTFHDNVTNNSRLTVPAGLGGTYLIAAHVEFAANATGQRQLRIVLNNTSSLARQDAVPQAAGIPTSMSLATVALLVAGDYVELVALQSSGGNLDVNAVNLYTPEFSMQRVG